MSSAVTNSFKTKAAVKKRFLDPSLTGIIFLALAIIISKPAFSAADSCRNEFVVQITGRVRSRANEAVNDSIGAIKAVSDEEIIKSYVNLARQDGIFCEPASAAGIAGLIKYSKNYDFKGQKIVCVVTGNGLKDPSTSEKHASSKIFEVDSNLDDVLKIIY